MCRFPNYLFMYLFLLLNCRLLKDRDFAFFFIFTAYCQEPSLAHTGDLHDALFVELKELNLLTGKEGIQGDV